MAWIGPITSTIVGIDEMDSGHINDDQVIRVWRWPNSRGDIILDNIFPFIDIHGQGLCSSEWVMLQVPIVLGWI